jgi:ParB/RepB/Spo0J family partition protein
MAKTGIKSIMVARKDQFVVPYGALVIEDGFNVREDFGDLDELAKNIAENGQRVAMKVRLAEDGKKLSIIDGHRRFLAINMANQKYGAKINTVLCVNEERGANEETRIVDLFTLNSGKPLTALEQASALKRLVDYNWSIPDIAKKIGIAQAKVRRLLDLNGASHDVREAVKKGNISASAASDLAKAPSKKQEEVLKKANGKKVKVKDVQRATVGKVYTVSTKKLSGYKDETTKTLKDATGQRARYLNGVLYGLKVACGEEEFKL